MSTTLLPSPIRILLLGAGELGTAFLPHLSPLPNTNITIGIRSPHKYTHLESTNIFLTAIDLCSPSSQLSEAFSNFDILVSATGFGQTPESILKLANEVLAAGKLRKERGEGKIWFFPWQFGVDYDITLDGQGLMPLFGAQKKVRDLLRSTAAESNVKWTIVSTGIFMSFLFEPFWSIVDRSKESERKIVVRALRDWKHGVTVTHVHDIGRVMGRIVAGDVDGEDKVLYVAGETVSYGNLADVVERVSKRRVEKEAWSIEYLEEELRKDPEDGIKKYRLVFARDGVWWKGKGTVNDVLGMQMMSVEEYVKQLFGGSC
jgi:hypothetical protein